MKEKIKKYWWIIIIILIIGGTFYWFQWRPSEIRKKCSVIFYYPLSPSWPSNSEMEQSYKECLRSHGLEK